MMFLVKQSYSKVFLVPIFNGIIYQPLGDYGFIHFFISCVESGWPKSLVQVTIKKDKPKTKLFIT